MTKWSQNQNVTKTIGESKIFKSHIAAKSEIVKIHWGNVAFWTAPNRHVRESICFMQRAERCKIEEIGLKYELLKFVRKIIYFWQTGAKSVCFISSGAQSAGGRILLL